MQGQNWGRRDVGKAAAELTGDRTGVQAEMDADMPHASDGIIALVEVVEA